MQMIERAIQELNEEGGSTEESISNFIRKEYDDLPWSHTTLLNHHLLELCKCGNVFLTCDQRYSLVAESSSSVNSSKKCSRKRGKRSNRDIRAKRLLQNKDQNTEAEIKKDIQPLFITRQDMDPSMSEGLSEHEEEQPTTRTNGIDSQCIPEKEEDPAMSSQKGLLPKSELTDNAAAAVSESGHVNLGRGERGACRIIFKYHRRHTAEERIISCRVENRKEEPSFLQQHRQEHEFLNCILALPVVLEDATDSKKVNSEIEFQLQTSKNRAKKSNRNITSGAGI